MTTLWKTRAELNHQIVLLAGRGNSRRQIARGMGVTRGLVGRVLAAQEAAGAEQHTVLPPVPRAQVPRASKLNPFEPRMRDLLASYPSITAARVLEGPRGAGYHGGYSVLKERVRKLLPPRLPEPSRVRPVFEPGMAEQDWSPYRVDFAGKAHSGQASQLTMAFCTRVSLKDVVYSAADWREAADFSEESIIVPNVVARIVGMRRKDEKHRIRCELVLHAPHAWRYLESDARVVQPEFLSASTAVGQDRALAPHADKKLATDAMGVFTAHFCARHSEDQKVPTRSKRNVLLEFPNGYLAAEIAETRHSVERHAWHKGFLRPGR